MTRRATIRSTVEHPATIADAIRPDNTTEMETSVEDGTVITTIERESTAGLRSTADDYVRNLTVALEVTRTANRHENDPEHTNT